MIYFLFGLNSGDSLLVNANVFSRYDCYNPIGSVYVPVYIQENVS